MSSGYYDIVVVGAGMVGACAAFALAGRGYRVAIVETARPIESDEVTGDQYELRVSAISPRSRGIFDQLGIWQQLNHERVCNYEQMYIWHQHGEASIAFDAVDLVRDNLDERWKPMVRIRSHRNEEWTSIYAKPDGKWMKMLLAVYEPGEAVVIQMRVRPAMFSQWLVNPVAIPDRMRSRDDGDDDWENDGW